MAFEITRYGLSITDKNGRIIRGKGNSYFSLKEMDTGDVFYLAEASSRLGYYYTDSIGQGRAGLFKLYANGEECKDVNGKFGFYIINYGIE